MRGCWKIGGICSSIVFSVLAYGIICRFHGSLGALLDHSPMLKDPFWVTVSLRLSSLHAGVFGNRGMGGFSKISDLLLGDGDLVLSKRSPCLSIGWKMIQFIFCYHGLTTYLSFLCYCK
jgi:hypothetical protein